MQQELIKKLKIAAEQFYLDLHQDKPKMSDLEYDNLSKEYELTEGRSVKDLVDWSQVGKMEHIRNYKSLPKIQVKDNDLESAVRNWITSNNISNYYINLKLDGGSLRAYYKDCKLYKVLSTPDEKFGQLRTDTLGQLFPQMVDDPTIESISGELVVDPKLFGYLSRSKSNGIINSKHRSDDIKKYAMVRVYRVTYNDSSELDYHRQLSTLKGLPELHDDTKCYFKVADSLELSDIPSTSITNVTGEWMLADGVVLYSDKGMMAFKFYYSEEAKTKVTNITYRKMKTGKWYPTVWFEPVTIEGNRISKAAGGSLDLVKKRGIGIGSVITVIRSNSTIPKILNVLETSSIFNEPTD